MKQYKSLNKTISAGYIFTNYNDVTDDFFIINDIIYCCFLQFDENGDIPFNASIEGYLNNIKEKANKYGTYVLFSFNGKETFSIVAKDKAKRQNAINNLIKLINELDLDGIDFDWEAPLLDEAINFTMFCKETYEAIKNNNPNHLFTAAVLVTKENALRMDITNSINYLDYVNIMTYGMNKRNGNYQVALLPSSDYHNKELSIGKTAPRCSIKEAIEDYLSLGVPKNKMLIGLAFYGITEDYVENEWVRGKAVRYTDIKNLEQDDNYTKEYDDKAKVHYLLAKNKQSFICYDSVFTIKLKCEYIKSEGVGGVMYWQNGQDLTGELLKTIKESI